MKPWWTGRLLCFLNILYGSAEKSVFNLATGILLIGGIIVVEVRDGRREKRQAERLARFNGREK
jgi:hypothetical protein